MIKASQAGTSLRQILLGLQGGVELATKSTDKWVVEVENADGTMRDLNDVVVDLRAAFADMTDAQKASNAESIAGKVGMSGLLAIVNATEKDFNKLTGAIDKSNGVAKNMADTMQNNLKGKVTQLKSALEGAGIAIGQNLIPALTNGVNKITDMVSAFNNLPPATQKTITSIGATVAAVGPLMMVGGKLITGVGKIISLVSTVTSLAGSGLVASLGAVALPLAAVGAGFYAWHEATDAANQSITVAREEMSFMERMMADLTGMTTYSKDELIEMGLVYKDFNENISTDFQNTVKDMTLDVHDFGLSLAEINVDKVITDEEANNLTTRVNGALESCISAIDTKSSELQDGFSKAFSVDGVIDENETALLEYWNSRGTKEKEEAQKLQSEINNIINTARAEGRELKPEEVAAIENYYAQIKQIELECQASNQYEIEYATQEFKNRISTMDAESAQQLLGQRFEQYQEQQLATKTNYDTLIEMAKQNGTDINGVLSEQAAETILKLEAVKEEELRINQERYDANINDAIKSNEELGKIFNRYTGKLLEDRNITNYQEYELMRKHYDGIEQVTSSGYKRVYDTATGTWKNLYVSVDSTTGLLNGVYDINAQKVISMTEKDKKALDAEARQWSATAEGTLANCLLMGKAYLTAEGNITDYSNKAVGNLGKVVDANGNVVDAILDLEGNPIDIGDNTDEVIKKLQNTQQEIKNTDGKRVKIELTDDGTADDVQSEINGIKGKTVKITINKVYSNSVEGPGCATGAESTMPGLTTVAEYGSELIVGRSGELTLATGRQIMNFEGGETVYNARQTKEILRNMSNNGNSSKDNFLLKEIVSKLDGVIKVTDNLKNYIAETTKAVEDKEFSPKIELNDEKICDDTSKRLAMSIKGIR